MRKRIDNYNTISYYHHMSNIFNINRPTPATTCELNNAIANTKDTGIRYWDHICKGRGHLKMIRGFTCMYCGLDSQGNTHKTGPKQ